MVAMVVTTRGDEIAVGALETARVIGTMVGGVVAKVGRVVLTTMGGVIFSGEPANASGETVTPDGSLVTGGAILMSPVSMTAVLGCWTMMCMLEDSCRLPSVEGQVACRGTPPKVSSFGVVMEDKLLASGLRILAEVGVEPGLTLGRSFLVAAVP